MMQELKKIWENIPMWLKTLTLVFLLYKLAMWLKAKGEKIALEEELKRDESGYNNSPGSGSAYNTYANVKRLYSAFYDDLTEDEALCKQILNNCPANMRRDFRSQYGKYLIDNYENWKAANRFSYWARHYGKSLQEDCLYFLEDDYKEVEYFFN